MELVRLTTLISATGASSNMEGKMVSRHSNSTMKESTIISTRMVISLDTALKYTLMDEYIEGRTEIKQKKYTAT